MPAGHPAWAEVSLGAIRENTRSLAAITAPAKVMAVVKAGGYGHGAVPVAAAALEGGARALAVATVTEGVELRDAGITAPVLLLSEPEPEVIPEALSRGLSLTCYSLEGMREIERAASLAAAGASGRETRPHAAVHLKVDTGMHRVGAVPGDVPALFDRLAVTGEVKLEGLWTHFACADSTERSVTESQIARFESVLDLLPARGREGVTVHAANSAGALAYPEARYDMVRSGIAIYGYPPVPGVGGFRAALSWKARVSFVKDVGAGEGVSYGHAYHTTRPTRLAVVPVGYADGVPRRYGFCEGKVLIGGKPRPVVGAVTMDQLIVDTGPPDSAGPPVRRGDEVVLVGTQGEACLSAEDWARNLGTISYEVLCAIGTRVPRMHLA